MKKLLISLLFTMMLLTLTACDSKDNYKESSGKSDIVPQEEKNEVNDHEYLDDEIIDSNDEDNNPYIEENIAVEKVINCERCVYAYFSEEKTFGMTLSEEEYTTDVTKLKTNGGKQRHNFFGFVLSDNKISRAYSCILKDNKIYCLEGSIDGSHHTGNIGILNQIFTSDQCRYISDGHAYVCTDGDYNGDTKTTGYASLHYETSCTIYGLDGKTGKMSCN